MPENHNTKKGSNRKNEPQEQKVSIKVKGQDAEQALRNQDQEILNKKEPKGKEEGRSGGGLVKGIVNFIKGIFTATIDMPQQGQPGSRENPNQQAIKAQTEWVSQAFSEEKGVEQVTKKRPEHLDQEKVIEAGKGLQELGHGPNASNKSIGTKAPDQTPPEAQQEKDGPQVGG